MADNTFVNIGGHKVSAGIKYSTTEVKTGDVWIDGKPIYRRTFRANLAQTSYAKEMPINYITYNIAEVIDVFWNIKQGASSNQGYNSWYSSANDNSRAVYTQNDKTLHITFGSAFNTNDIITATIYYTKTTD